MGNLNQSPQEILMNTLSAEDFGVYTSEGVKQLLFKGAGITLPAKGANGEVSSVIKSCSVDGVLKQVFVQYNDECPCEECGYDYGIEIKSKVQKRGVFNVQLPVGKYYGDKLDKVTCTNNEIDAAYFDIMYSTTIDLINKDTKGAGAIISAVKGEVVAVSNSETAVIEITVAGGTAQTISGSSGDDILDLVDAINTDVDLVGEVLASTDAVATDTAGTIKIVQVGSSSFSVTDTTNASTDGAGMFLTAKDVNEQFEVVDSAMTSTTTVIEAGSYPFLSSDDMARIFSIKRMDFGSQPNVPIKGVKYCLFSFKVKGLTNYAQHGANAMNTYNEYVNIYVPLSALATDLWLSTDMMNDAPVAPDQTFEELLAAWA